MHGGNLGSTSGISGPSREQRESSSAGLHAARWGMGACVLPAWGVCMGVGHKDLGRLHGHGAVCCFVPDGPEKMESKQHCIETTLRLQTGRNSQDSHVCQILISSIVCRLYGFTPEVSSSSRSSVRLNHERAGYGPYAADTRRPRRRSTHDRSTGPAPPAGQKAKFAHLKRTCGPNGGRRTSFIAHRPQRVSEGATEYSTGIVLADK